MSINNSHHKYSAKSRKILIRQRALSKKDEIPLRPAVRRIVIELNPGTFPIGNQPKLQSSYLRNPYVRDVRQAFKKIGSQEPSSLFFYRKKGAET